MTPYNYFMPQNTQQYQQLVQANGFISVRNETEAYNYPVAAGNCVTFKVEGQPIVIEKSMGFSQFESPKIERYRLVKEDGTTSAKTAQFGDFEEKADKNALDDVKAEIEQIWAVIEDLKSKQKPGTKKTVEKVKDDE